MRSIIDAIVKLLSNPVITFSIIAFMSFSALFAALFSEAFLGLEPCILCVVQRYPFAIGIALALIGLGVRKNVFLSRIIFAFSGLGFLVNSGVALYQTGIQLRWWLSGIEACSVSFMEDSSPQSILENLMSAPMSSCDEITWADPVLGLTIANYNIVFSFGLFVFCLLAAWFVNKNKSAN
jgi:disulfide bond formation protein DsbB